MGLGVNYIVLVCITVDTTFDVVVFNCEDSVVGFLSISDDTISIDWLNREDIKHSSVDSLCCESLLSF